MILELAYKICGHYSHLFKSDKCSEVKAKKEWWCDGTGLDEMVREGFFEVSFE